MEARKLAAVIRAEDAQAEERSAQIEGQDVALFFGGCGNGKTAVLLYAQGVDYQRTRVKAKFALVPSHDIEGFEVSDRRGDVTQGLAFAELNGISYVDSAGQGATSGPVTELRGAINRCAVLQKARSVRVVLVVKDANFDVGVGRGGFVTRSFEHVASLISDIQSHVSSVGLILTSDERQLLPGVAALALSGAQQALEGLLNSATQHDDSDDGWTFPDGEAAGHQISQKGLVLVRHLWQQCTVACELAEQIPEGQDLTLVQQLVERGLGVFPVNVTDPQQRPCFLDWVSGIQPVQRPQDAMEYHLPSHCSAQMESKLSQPLLSVKRQMADHGYEWVFDETLVQDVVDQLDLAGILVARGLLPAVERPRADLCEQILRENRLCVEILETSLCQGHLQPLEKCLDGLASMDLFRQRCGTMVHGDLQGWLSKAAALATCIKRAETVLDEKLPNKWSSHWDLRFAQEVSNTFQALEKVEDPRASQLLEGWAQLLWEHMTELQRRAIDCSSAMQTAQALSGLKNADDFLSQALLPLMSKHHHSLQDFRLQAFVGDAKDQVLQKLQEMSEQAVKLKGQTPQGNLEIYQKLQELCRSTELNAMLQERLDESESLEQRFVSKPLSNAFAPEQWEINALKARIENGSPPEDFAPDLQHLAQRLDACKDVVPELVKAQRFSFEEVFDKLKKQVTEIKQSAEKALLHLAPRTSGRNMPSSGASTDSTTDDDLPTVEEGDAQTIKLALDHLSAMLPLDRLLLHLGDAACVSASVTSLGYCMVRKLRSSLSAAERKSGRKKWGNDMLRSELFGHIHLLQVLQNMAKDMVQMELGDLAKDLKESLENLQGKVDEFIQGSVTSHIKEWKKASTDTRGWHHSFAEHMRTARKFDQLHGIPEVDAAIEELQQKIESFYQRVLQDAETGDKNKDWHLLATSLRDGYAFEESDLFRLLPRRQKTQEFRGLVEMQVDRCCAAARLASPDDRLNQWQRLTLLMDQLPKDFRQPLEEARKELDQSLNDAESRFLKALTENNLSDAARLLAQVQHPERHCDDFRREICAAEKQLDVLGEVEDVIPAAKKLRSLDDIDGAIADPKIASLVRQSNEDAKEKLTSLGEEAAENLQKALEGDGPPNHALSIYAALSGKKKTKAGKDAIVQFAANKKQEFASMNRENLMRWIEQHNHTWTCKDLPEELKSAKSDLLDAFMQNLKRSFESELQKLEDLQQEDEKDGKHPAWQSAKALCEELRDAVQMAEKLELLRPFSSQLSQLKQQLNKPTSREINWVKQKLREGTFVEAVRALVRSDGDTEQQFVDEIEEAFADNKNLSGCDAMTMRQRLESLKAFQAAAGKDPPYQIRQFVKEASKLVAKHEPELNEKVKNATEAILSAASSTERDLKLLAKALEENKDYEKLASETQSQAVEQSLADFNQAIRRSVATAVQDVTAVDGESLQVHLQPIKHHVKVFQALSPEQQKLLCERLSFGAGLLEWIEELMAPCGKILGADALLPLLGMDDLTELSKRMKIVEKLNVLGDIGNAKVMEEHVLKHVSEQKEIAIEAMKAEDFTSFNERLKRMGSVADALPQLQLSTHVQALERALRKEVLGKHKQAIRKAETAHAAVEACVRLRKVANEAADTYGWVLAEIETALDDLASSPFFQNGGLVTVEQQLHLNEVGRSILAENPRVFGAVKELLDNDAFRNAGMTADVDKVVSALTGPSELGDLEYWDLRHALERHEQLLKTLTQRYLFVGKPLEQVKAEAQAALRKAVQECGTNTNVSVQTLLTHLAACYMLVKSGKTYLEASPSKQAELQSKLTTPHRAQMLTLFRFLQAHQKPQHGFFPPLWRWIFGTSSAEFPENHLAEVKTGEGKCLLLNMTAAFFALRGIKVDIACYQKALMEQDSRAMLEFNKFLGVDTMIRHVTLDELCHERLKSIVDHSKALLAGETPQSRRVDVSQRVLLIDEVDMLFTQRFYGKTWDGGFTLKSQAAKELVKYVFKQRSSGKEIPDITSTEVFQTLLRELPEEMHRSAMLAADCLVKNWENFSEPKPELDSTKTQVGYTGKVDIDWSLSYKNKTVFAYLQMGQDSDIAPEVVEDKLGVDFLAGMFSFADLPRSYKYILGVTGTLRELMKIPGLGETLRNDYDFRHFTYAPSIFGSSRNLCFHHAEHVRLCDDEADWISKIESAIAAHKSQGEPVLVFFRNQTELQKLPQWKKYEVLSKKTDPSKVMGYVAAATNEGQVTLLTKNFGRGLDFQMKSHEVVVLQTFLSSTESEQTQIQGRTARKGKAGKYRLILCAEHLEAKMGFSADDLHRLGRGEQIKELLEQKQQEKTMRKVQNMRQHLKTASRIEQRTKQWEELLFSSASRPAKLIKLAAWNEEQCSLHYTLLVDNSGSMRMRWAQLIKAVRRFKEELQLNSHVANMTKVSVVVFNSDARVIQAQSLVADLTDLPLDCEGKTSFRAAFQKGREVMRSAPPESNEFVLFFTDGECSDRPEKVPKAEINALLEDHSSRIKGLTCIAFGTDAGKGTLNEIGKIFKQYRPTIDFQLQEASTEESLVQCFAEAGASGAIHCC